MIKVNFQMVLPTSNLDVSNYKKPLSFSVNADDIFYVNPLCNQVFIVKLKQFTVKDYIGLFPQWNERLSIYDIGGMDTHVQYRHNETKCDPSEIAKDDSLICHPYFHFVFQSSGELVYNKRTYRTVAQTVGAIGGTNSVVIIVLLLLYGPINDMKRKDYITRKIYSLVGMRDADLKKGLAYAESGQMSDKIPHGSKHPASIGDNVTTNGEDQLNEPKNSFWRCFCCRKKTQADIEWKARVKQAHRRIEDSLDVMTIVKNFNYLQVLTHFFFEERHFDLAQYVGFDLWRNEQDEKARRLTDDQEEDKKVARHQHRKLRKVKMSRRILLEKKRFNRWLSYIQDRHMNYTQDDNKIKSEVASSLDDFFYNSLAKHQSAPKLDIKNSVRLDGLNSISRTPVSGNHRVPQDEDLSRKPVSREQLKLVSYNNLDIELQSQYLNPDNGNRMERQDIQNSTLHKSKQYTKSKLAYCNRGDIE